VAHITNKWFKMANMTLSIPDNLYEKMKTHKELKWSEIARQTFERKINEVELLDKMLKNSKLTEANVEEIGNKIKAEIRKRF
jgi:predicted CopG family antitoxin|tara:strand:- start:15917 stop:16162 length:246 start_codon:yes stop_codon:yes gene_type:complete